MNEYSGILIPIVAMLIPIVAIVAGAMSEAQKRRIRADQQMALIARGVPLAEVDSFLRVTGGGEAGGRVKDPMRSLGNARRSAVVLMSVGTGLTLFFLIFGFVLLKQVDREAGWALIACAATGLIPFAIGVGFLFDYRLQTRELTRFGLEVEVEAERR
jgi:hypothetical protein